MFAEIAVNKKNMELDKLFTYEIPELEGAKVSPGTLVQVPFGGEKLLGIVVSLVQVTEVKKLRPIIKVVSEQFLTVELLELGLFIATRYIAPLAAVLFSMAVFGTKIKNSHKLKKLPITTLANTEWPQLVPAQEEVLKTISAEEGGRFLLHGITGSGKTEVYMHLFQNAFENDKQGLLLVPEIALTPQLTGIFANRFGNRVQVLHSKLSDGERLLVWQKALKGEIDGIIGARSAIFAPFQRLGVIIMDEEHEYSFKQESIPRFHTRVLAGWRAKHNKATLLYGSATPAIESYYAALSKKLTLLTMPERIAQRPLPKVEIIDLRAEMKSGNRSIFSITLLEKLGQRLERGEQSILFLNRRGYSAFVGCRDCGEIIHCPHCAVTLTYHHGVKELRCHYCEYKVALPMRCPKCQSTNFRRFGVGTERIEEELQKFFPEARTIRMDVDTTSRKEAHQEMYEALKKGEVDILIGTQMVTKGLDLPKVTLVGVIDADISLFMPDFRAREKTFQLLTQVAGRAGRGDLPGEVIFQTFHPEDPTLLASAEQDYRAFCQRELYTRKMLDYPPYSSMVRLVFSGENSVAVENGALSFVEELKKLISDGMHILGPAPAPIARLRGKYRWHAHVKSVKVTEVLSRIKAVYDAFYSKLKKENVVVHIDVDPYSTM